MGTLIYSPAVAVVIESSVAGLVDVSDDASVGSLTLRENGSHSLQLTLENPRRKYDGLFTPNDRIVVQMRRFQWLQVFSGYLDSAPYFSAYAKKVNLSAQCPIKVLRYWPWDRGSKQSLALMFEARNANAQDGGMSEIIKRLLTEVANWPSSRIHIGGVPAAWWDNAEKVFNRLDAETRAANEPIIGVNPILSGEAFTVTTTKTDANGQAVANGQKDSYPISAADYDVVRATIRQASSNGNYTLVNSTTGTTGAYQVTDAAWDDYRGYARASDAPRDVQDSYAQTAIEEIIAKYGARLINIPLAWYAPEAIQDEKKLDVPLTGVAGTNTPRTIAYNWIDRFLRVFSQMRGHAYSNAAGASSTSFYPIPPGTKSLTQEQMAWGGFKNGEIPIYNLGNPLNPMKPGGAALHGWGHPICVEAYNKMYEEAKKVGINLRGGCYRDAYTQRLFKVRDLLGAQGYRIDNAPADKAAEAWREANAMELKSSHGWGLAVDVGIISYGDSSTYKRTDGWTMEKLYTTPEYQWLKQNAFKWGFSQTENNMDGSSGGEAWHWDFFGIANYNKDGTTKGTDGWNPFTGQNVTGLGDMAVTSEQLYNLIAAWTQDPNDVNLYSDLLAGRRALLNDEALLTTIASLVKASGRSYCSAPNGDFISWWPDYWGEYGIAGKIEIETVELNDFSVDWNDASMITHQFVEGALLPEAGAAMGPLPHGIMDPLHAMDTRGVATVEMPGLLAALLNIPEGTKYPWMKDPQLLLRRFGARVNYLKDSAIYGPQQEFFAAISMFARAWADQFQASVPLTFMPEVFPGMLLSIPYFKVQMYVKSVTHSWDYSNGAGFTTQVSTMAVSSSSGSGFFIFPHGGDPIVTPPDPPKPTRGQW